MTPRARLADHYDSELSRHHERLFAAVVIGPSDRVLDIGCGAGESTRAAARAARSGSALGVDISERMLERARRRSAEEGVHNVTYELGDAQVHPFRPAHYDVVISRFGTMFFRDPVAAFTNIARAARSGARLAMMVWQHHDRNEWATAIHAALAGGVAAPGTSASALDPFSLADRPGVESILGAAGFVEVGFIDVDVPVDYGPDGATACDLVRDMQMTGELLAALDADGTERALARLRETIAAHQTDEGVLFGSRAWIVTAHRGG